ncbi:MAG: hypothetical protein PHO32_01205 [Candidatus Cloacimonetes bacterium]|nr:hypothetical protein [Candidatus Cloacimonadota bacterium]
MDKRTRRRVKGIAIFIVFLAIITAVLQYQKREGKTVVYDFKPSQNEYRDLRFINKAQISFSAHSVPKAQAEIGKIMSTLAIKRILKQTEGGYGVYIFSIPQKELATVVDRLRGFGSVISQREQIYSSLANIDYTSENARLQSYEREQADLTNVRFPSELQIRRKEALHALIHQARLNLDELKDADNVLLYITLVPVQRNSGILLTIKMLSVGFLSWLSIYTVLMVLVYYGTRMLMYFLSAIGVKGVSSGGLGGSYQYGGYTGYSGKYSGRYNYGSGKRKIKRVYKDKRSTPTAEDEETKDN